MGKYPGSRISWTYGKALILISLFCSGGEVSSSARVEAKVRKSRGFHAHENAENGRMEDGMGDEGRGRERGMIRDSSSLFGQGHVDKLRHVVKRAVLLEVPAPKDFSGFFGCLVNANVCHRDERCIDDNLFGSCQRRSDSDVDRYRYHLTSEQERLLEGILLRLVEDGYTWNDLHTQCIIGNVLLAFELGQNYNADYCNDDERISRNSGRSLYGERAKMFLPRDINSLEELVLLNEDVESQHSFDRPKKDEFVSIHKYNKERNKKRDKLQPWHHSTLGHKGKKNAAPRIDSTIKFLKSLNEEDLNLLEDLLFESEPETAKENLNSELEPELEPEMSSLSQAEAPFSVHRDQWAERPQFDADEMNKDYTIDDQENMIETPPYDSAPDMLEPHVESNSLQQLLLPGSQTEDISQLNESESDTIINQGQKIGGLAHSVNQELADKRSVAGSVNAGRMERQMTTISDDSPRFAVVDESYTYLIVKPKLAESASDKASFVVSTLESLLGVPQQSFSDVSVYHGDINFHVDSRSGLNATTVAATALAFADDLENGTGYRVVEAGIGHVTQAYVSVMDAGVIRSRYFFLMLILCGVMAGILLAVIVLYFIRRRFKSREKLKPNGEAPAGGRPGIDVSKEYQELCRQHMMSKIYDKTTEHVGRVGSITTMEVTNQQSPSSRSSTSSWSEEPVTTSMDILTGHMVLSYMEDHLKTKDRLDKEWESLCTYEPELSDITIAILSANEQKNRYLDVVPYDHSRVVLHSETNQNQSDYINASLITDHDPRSPAYIITQGPLQNTVADFWQMVWEQGSVVIVNLCKLVENGGVVCYRYWPTEGSILCHMYEVHLVSEHIWCDDYLIRSFYLKNIQTNETRTVTQFHFITWPVLGVPSSSKSLLDFRRKVNKSYRGRSCPIVIHCRKRAIIRAALGQQERYILACWLDELRPLCPRSPTDGAGRSGTYCLIDMVLNRINKGAKELDIAATLEHIRDQRMQMVKTKEQFEFVLATVAEEVHAVLKALPQS